MSEGRSAMRIAALVAGVVIAVVAVVTVTGGADEDSRLDDLANDPIL